MLKVLQEGYFREKCWGLLNVCIFIGSLSQWMNEGKNIPNIFMYERLGIFLFIENKCSKIASLWYEEGGD